MIPAHLRQKRIWNVADFAEFTGISPKAARARLKKYNDLLNGKLLTDVGGSTGFTFQPALLSRVLTEVGMGGLFESVESLEMRVADVEDKIGDMHQTLRLVSMQTGANSRDISVLQRKKVA